MRHHRMPASCDAAWHDHTTTSSLSHSNVSLVSLNKLKSVTRQLIGQSLVTLGGVLESQKTSSVEDWGQIGDNGEMATSDMELL